MDDLAAFLRARLDEDEAYLRELTAIGERKRDAATEADYAANMPAFLELLADPAVQRIMQRQEALKYPPPNDVGRILRDIETKRQLIECASHATGLDMQVDSEFRVGLRDTDDDPYLGDVILRHLAAVYSGHPGYRDEWKP